MCECVYTTSSFLLSPSVTSFLIAIRGSQSHSVPNKVGATGIRYQTLMHSHTCIYRHTSTMRTHTNHRNPHVSDWNNRKRTLCLSQSTSVLQKHQQPSQSPSALKLSFALTGSQGRRGVQKGKRLGYHDINLHVSFSCVCRRWAAGRRGSKHQCLWECRHVPWRT